LEEALRGQALIDKKDRWMIAGAPDGTYTTEWLRECMESFKIMGQIQQNFWNKWVPKKVNIFIWRLVKDRVPTRQKLCDMGMDIPSTICPICEILEEDTTHLFFDCSKVAGLWQKFGVWWSVNIPRSRQVEDIFAWSWQNRRSEKDCCILQVAIIAILFSIWRTRNGVIFEKKKMEVDKEFRNAQELAFFWLYNRNGKFKNELNSWISNPKI
jgi:hypothetical protein